MARASHLLPTRRSRLGRDQFLRSCRHHQHAAPGARGQWVEKFYALVGGLHLAPAPEGYLRQVIAELKKFDLEHVLAMLCSGQNFVDLAKQEMPEKLVLCTTGSRYTFTA